MLAQKFFELKDIAHHIARRKVDNFIARSYSKRFLDGLTTDHNSYFSDIDLTGWVPFGTFSLCILSEVDGHATTDFRGYQFLINNDEEDADGFPTLEKRITLSVEEIIGIREFLEELEEDQLSDNQLALLHTLMDKATLEVGTEQARKSPM